MNKHEFQDDLEIIEDEEEMEFFDDSVYYHHPDYPEFDGWRELML